MEDLIGEGRLTDIDVETLERAATGDTDPEPSAFAQRVDREGRRRGFPEAQRRVILGDDAAWTASPGSAGVPPASCPFGRG